MTYQTLTADEVKTKCNTPHQEYIEYSILSDLFGTEVTVTTPTHTERVEFSFSNGKINETAVNMGIPQARIAVFDLPAGYTCPKASLCLAYANRRTGKLIVGKECKFECYAAKAERFRHSSRDLHWRNYEKLLKLKDQGPEAIAQLLIDSLPTLAKGIYKLYVCRIHSSGDFYSQEYYEAWKLTAAASPGTLYFGYTKILDYILDDTKPDNMRLVYSYGGKDDSRRDEIAAAGTHIPTAYVVNNAAEAAALNVPISCPKNSGPATTNDILYIINQESFALLVH